MTGRKESILVLALGNDIMGDDGVAIAAARQLRETLGDGCDVIETAEAGIGMIDILSFYDRALLLDSIEIGDQPTGTVIEFSREDFDKVLGPSPHYAGLPEVIELAKRLRMAFPRRLRVLAIKIDPQDEFRQGLSPEITRALPDYVDAAARIVRKWMQESARDISDPKPA